MPCAKPPSNQFRSRDVAAVVGYENTTAFDFIRCTERAKRNTVAQ